MRSSKPEFNLTSDGLATLGLRWHIRHQIDREQRCLLSSYSPQLAPFVLKAPFEHPIGIQLMIAGHLGHRGSGA